jgi:hypothetical protein
MCVGALAVQPVQRGPAIVEGTLDRRAHDARRDRREVLGPEKAVDHLAGVPQHEPRGGHGLGLHRDGQHDARDAPEAVSIGDGLPRSVDEPSFVAKRRRAPRRADNPSVAHAADDNRPPAFLRHRHVVPISR